MSASPRTKPTSSKIVDADSSGSSNSATTSTECWSTGPPTNTGASSETSGASPGTASVTFVSAGRFRTSPSAPSSSCSVTRTTARLKCGSKSDDPATSSLPFSEPMSVQRPCQSTPVLHHEGILLPQLGEEPNHRPSEQLPAVGVIGCLRLLEQAAQRALVVALLEGFRDVRQAELVQQPGDLARRGQLVEELRDRRGRLRADELGDDVAVPERLDGGDAAHAVALGELGVRVDVHLDELDVVLFRRALEHRSELMARAAPVGPEVDDDRVLPRAPEHIVREGGGVDVHQRRVPRGLREGALGVLRPRP